MARGTNENYSYGKILLRKYYATWAVTFLDIFPYLVPVPVLITVLFAIPLGRTRDRDKSVKLAKAGHIFLN